MKTVITSATWSWHQLTRLRHVYLIAVILFLLFFKGFWDPDILFLIFLSVFVLYGQAIEFIKRFLPLVLLLMSYEALRGFVPFLNKHVHFTTMIDFDRWIGLGQLPTVRLQELLYNGSLHWYDYYFYFCYMLHFLAPFLLALAIWKFRPHGYWRYITALLALSYAGFLTYLLFPAAPPWMASDAGLIPHITKLSTAIWWSWGVHNTPSLYTTFDPNAVAAVPSLHAAYPTLDLLFVWRLFGRKVALPFLIYPLSVWLGVVYMGEHYLFDVLLGIAYAGVAFVVTERLWARYYQDHVASRKAMAVAAAKG